MERLPEDNIPSLDFRQHLDIIRKFTAVYKACLDKDPAIREISCLKTMYPGALVPLKEREKQTHLPVRTD